VRILPFTIQSHTSRTNHPKVSDCKHIDDYISNSLSGEFSALHTEKLSFFISVNRFSVVSRVNIYSVASSIKQLTQSEYIGLILFRRLAYCFNVGKRPCISGSNYQNQKLLDTLKNLVYIFNMFEQLMKHLFLNIYIK
jgi:hypothetical protein